MKTLSRVSVVTLVLLVSGVSGGRAWCNRKEQANTQAETDFELPSVKDAARPFSFEDPDPARLLRQLSYTIDPAAKSVFQVGVSNNLSPQQATDVQAGILGLVAESMCRPGDGLVVWSSDLRRIATIRNDPRVQDCSPKWLKFKVSQNRAELARLNQYFQELKESDRGGPAVWDLPQLCHHLGQEFHEWHDCQWTPSLTTLGDG